MAKGDVRVVRTSRRTNGRTAEVYIVEEEPGLHWRWAEED